MEVMVRTTCTLKDRLPSGRFWRDSLHYETREKYSRMKIIMEVCGYKANLLINNKIILKKIFYNFYLGAFKFNFEITN